MERIPFNDLSVFHREISARVFRDLEALVAESDFIGGKRLETFEKDFAAFAGVRHALGLSNGTDAVTLGLKALGVGPGDEVITVANTFVATLEAIIMAGARPVLVDCDEHSSLIAWDQVEAAITSRTRAVVPVHLYGTPADLSSAERICSKHGLGLLQDAAQAHGARWNGRALGDFPGVQTYSFFPGKNLGAWGDAGAAASSDDTLADFIRAYRNHGRFPGAKYTHDRFGGNFRMDPLQAVVLGAKLPFLAEKNKTRRRHYIAWKELLAGAGDLRFFEIAPEAEPVHHLCVVRTARRDALQEALKKKGVGTGVHYPVPCHLQPSMREYGWKKGQFPVSEKLATEILSLPFYPEMGASQLEQAAAAVRGSF